MRSQLHGAELLPEGCEKVQLRKGTDTACYKQQAYMKKRHKEATESETKNNKD